MRVLLIIAVFLPRLLLAQSGSVLGGNAVNVGNGAGGTVVPVVAGGGGATAPAIDTTLTKFATNTAPASSLTVTVNAGTGANRLMLFVVTEHDTSGRTITAPSFNGVSSTIVTNCAWLTTVPAAAHRLYGLIAPATGSHTATVSWNANVDLSWMQVFVVTNANQGGGTSTFFAANTNHVATGINTNSYAGAASTSLAFGSCVIPDTSDDGFALTVSAGQTVLSTASAGFSNMEADVSTQPGAATVKDTWQYKDGTSPIESGSFGVCIKAP